MYLPAAAEIKKCFTIVQQPAGVANITIDAPLVLQTEFSAVTKSKAAVILRKEQWKSAGLELMERKKVQCRLCCHGSEEEEVNADEPTS